VTASLQYELRVLNGEQRGANSLLQMGKILRLGSDFFNDIVLPDAHEATAQLRLTENGELRLIPADTGPCAIDGTPVAISNNASKEIPVALYTPITVGDARIAVGCLGAPQWASLFDEPMPAKEPVNPVPVSTTASETTAAATAAVQQWLSGRIQRMVAYGAIALSVVFMGSAAIAWILSPAAPLLSEQEEQWSRTLDYLEKEQGLKIYGRNIQENKGKFTITGYLENKEKYYNLKEALASQALLYGDASVPKINIWIYEEILREVEAVFKNNHVSMEIIGRGQEKNFGIIDIKTQELEDDNFLKKMREVQVAAEKIPGLKELKVENIPPSSRLLLEPELLRYFDTEIVSIVFGEASKFLKAKNGTHYYEDSLLPSGYVLSSIVSASQVKVEKNGEFHLVNWRY